MCRFTFMLAASIAFWIVGDQAQGGSHGAVCPKCKACCTLKVTCDTEKKPCFEVECEQICVPRVVFPWQTPKNHKCSCKSGCVKCSCVNRGAWVKTVKKLTLESCECPVCKYEWTPAGCCNGSHGGYCVKKGPANLATDAKLRQVPDTARLPAPPQPKPDAPRTTRH